MNRGGMIDLVQDNTGVSYDDVETVINNFLDAIGDTLVTQSVDLDVFGEFFVVTEDGKKKPKFKAGSDLSGKVN